MTNYYLKKLILIPLSVLIFGYAGVVSSQVNITTLSNWEIKSYSPHDLMVVKRGKEGTYFGFTVDRPNCICGQPIFNLSTLETPEKDKVYTATISVDLKKPKKIDFFILQTWAKDDTTVLLRPLRFPSLTKASVIDIKFENTFKDVMFTTEGMKEVQEQSTEMCKSFYPYEKVEKKTGMEIRV